MLDLTLPKQKHHIADFHCDLLCYLAGHSQRSAYDRAPRCGILQLKQGRVKIQTMAIFSETEPNSSKKGFAQAEIYKELPKLYPDVFEIIHSAETLQMIENSEKIGIIPAIENASCICSEEDDLDKALKKFESIQKKMGRIAYLSLTWNTENRFGGGALTKVGLKEDGKSLMEYLYKHQIALDLSHASDYLAYDCLNYLDKKGLSLPIVASHSNFRVVKNVPRNLPDDLAKEILNRGGIIGLNVIRSFVGEESTDNFLKQLEHALKFEKREGICFGADFFYEEDLPPAHRKPVDQLFFPNFDHAGTYEMILNLWRDSLIVSEQNIKDICFKNLQSFLLKSIYNN